MARGERRRLGAPFAWALSAGGVSNLTDGLMLAAGPLMVAHLTSDPFFVSFAVVMQQLPWVLFGLLAGVVADRVSRVAILAVGSTVRALAFAAVVAFLVTGAMSLPVLYAALFLVGTTEAFMDNAWSSLVPDVVTNDDLGVANARVSGVMTVSNQLVGPALGGILFTVGTAVPYAGSALLAVVAALLILPVRPRLAHVVGSAASEPSVPPLTGEVPIAAAHALAGDPAGDVDQPDDAPAPTRAAPGFGGAVRSVRDDIASGARWLWANGPVRVLALVILCLNVTFGMTWGVLVLWSTERLGLGPEGYGSLLAVSAVGGLLSAAAFGWIERRFPYGAIMRVVVTLETVLHAAIAITTAPGWAYVVVFVFGAYATVWGALSNTIRGRLVPTEVRGRVTSVYLLGSIGGMAAGAFVGGVIAQFGGVVAPMWVAAGVNVVLLVVFWRWLPIIGEAGRRRDDTRDGGSRAA